MSCAVVGVLLAAEAAPTRGAVAPEGAPTGVRLGRLGGRWVMRGALLMLGHRDSVEYRCRLVGIAGLLSCEVLTTDFALGDSIVRRRRGANCRHQE